jgi:hypothetical protein
MGRLRERWSEKVSAMGTAARLWWVALGTVATAAVLVLAATTVSDATSHPAVTISSAASPAAPSAPASNGAGSGSGTSSTSGSAGASGSTSMPGMAGMASGASGTSSSSSTGTAQTSSTTCPNVKGTTVMADGMVMAPVPSGQPTAAQQAAANQLVAQTKATLTEYSSLSAATAAGYVPATNPNGRVVHYANWSAARTDGFDPSNPAFLVYANTVNGPVLMGAMYLGPAPCTPGPDVGGPLTQWHAHDNLCLSGGQVVGRTSASGTCASGVHNTNTYFMLHVWTEPSLAATHQFQADLTRAELVPIILGTA